MRVSNLIYKKREGKELSASEIKYLINKYTSGEIPDYQISAWAMAVYFQGMNDRETADLTMEMARSGDQLDLSSLSGKIIDKHSTGGVGDTTTLVLAPLVASCGVPVAKMSGKGLGHTGGTIDKLHSIPGFNSSLSENQFMKNVKNIGIAIASQTKDLAPADKKLYALRDVTATIESIPLIASSIMSKKIAGGADGLVLDVKTGNGAFMKNMNQAKKLAVAMVEIGKRVNKETIAIISDMNQPLGKAVGNSLEVREAIDTLKDKGPEDLKELCLNLGANMLKISGQVDNLDQGYEILQKSLKSGKALNKFKDLIRNQGGNDKIINDYSLLPSAQHKIEIKSDKSGFINKVNSRKIGLTSMEIGAGREKKEDNIDPAVSIVLKKKSANKVKQGKIKNVLHINDKKNEKNAIKNIKNAYEIKEKKPEANNLIKDIID